MTINIYIYICVCICTHIYCTPLPPAEVDGFVPQSRNVNLTIFREPGRGEPPQPWRMPRCSWTARERSSSNLETYFPPPKITS